MNDVWFGPGLTRDDFDAFLDALALDRRNGGPLLAVATGDSRLVMASFAFFALFDVTGSEALSRRLLGGRDPGARRLADLCRSLPLEGAPRLERLRFTIGPASEVITFLCRRFTTAAGLPVFVAAALGVRPGLMPVAPAAPAEASEAPPGMAEPTPAFAAPMNVQAIHEALAQRWPSTARVRFLWQSDADGICREISAPLAAGSRRRSPGARRGAASMSNGRSPTRRARSASGSAPYRPSAPTACSKAFAATA